jgi:hypothetical protein
MTLPKLKFVPFFSFMSDLNGRFGMQPFHRPGFHRQVRHRADRHLPVPGADDVKEDRVTFERFYGVEFGFVVVALAASRMLSINPRADS